MTEKAFEQMMSGLKEAKDEYGRTVFPDCRSKYYAVRDAIELLKKQEPVHPIKQYDGNPGDLASWWYVCGNCERDIDCYDKFCRSCGRAVMWDEG